MSPRYDTGDYIKPSLYFGLENDLFVVTNELYHIIVKNTKAFPIRTEPMT